MKRPTVVKTSDHSAFHGLHMSVEHFEHTFHVEEECRESKVVCYYVDFPYIHVEVGVGKESMDHIRDDDCMLIHLDKYV